MRRLLPVLAWLLVGLVFASQFHLFASRTGGRLAWRDAFLWEVPRWMLWAFLAPLAARFARRWPVRKPHAVRSAAIHLLLGTALSGIHMVVFVYTYHFLRRSFGEQGSLDDAFLFAFTLDFHVGIAVYWLILLLTQNREAEQRMSRLQAELAQAQLHALKMQLHPHFLFNTLNSISSYLRTDVEVADEMIGRLGDFLRLTLQSTGMQDVTLEKEVDFLKHYLEIEQLRFQDRLQTEFAIETAAKKALVPNLILQPVVENAVRHGVAVTAGMGVIRIQAALSDGLLRIVISDNGPGFPAQVREGVGIATTRDRVSKLHGERARFELANQPGGGAVVTLELPASFGERKA